MALLSLGLSSIPVPAVAPAPHQAAPDLQEYGASGTSLFGGWLRDVGEYNPELTGTSAFQVYERMRRSDAQVAAVLAAMKLPIRSAQWTIQEPRDASPVEKEATEFIREELLESIDWDQVLSNALLMLDFGCACHEDVYLIDGNRVRLKKLAPRLPITINRWLCGAGTEDLAGIEQYAELPSGGFGTATVPIDKAALFVFQQEGSNWAGRSVLRSAYQHWYVKANLYKVDALAQERNGMGIPWLELPQGASREDKQAAQRIVEQICAHERAGVVTPNGGKFSLQGVAGTVRDALPTIQHHDAEIARAALAMFLNLGQSESGNRALGESQTDFFALSLQATAAQIARVLRLTSVGRLVGWNFGAEVRPPIITPAQIVAVPLSTVMTALQALSASGFIGPDQELEKELRAKLGLPAAVSRPRPAVPPSQPEVKDPAPAAGKVAASEAGPKLRREPGSKGSTGARRAEKCLALADIVGELDRGRDQVAAALRRARARVQAEIVNKLVNAPVRSIHRVSIELDARLVAEVEQILAGAYEFGSRQVDRERSRQLGGAEPATAAQIRLADRRGKRDPLGVYADGVVGEFTNSLTSRAANTALDWMRRPAGATKGEIIGNIQSDLDQQSDKWVDGAAAKGVNEAFADGRADGYERYKDEINSVIYSALLDINTCSICADADGQEAPTPDELPGAPNPDCDGGDRCRCVHVYVFDAEGTGGPLERPGTGADPSGPLAEAVEEAADPEAPDFPATSGLAARMEGNSAFETLARENGRDIGEQTRQMLMRWTEGSSNGPDALAVQLAAEREFKLPRKAWETIQQEHFAGAQQILETRGSALQSFLRSMYEETQAWLKANRVESVTLYRGVSGVEAAGLRYKQVMLRALSSFTTDFSTAVEYVGGSGGVLAIDVPASRVLSTPFTGFGARDLREVVVLAGPADRARVFGWSSATGKPAGPEDLIGRLKMSDRKGESPFIDPDAQDQGDWLVILRKRREEERKRQKAEEEQRPPADEKPEGTE